MLTISTIVEGHGEVAAIPILVRRIGLQIDPSLPIYVPNPPFRLPRTKVLNEFELTRAVRYAKSKIEGAGGIFILMDADDDCPAELGPRIAQHAQTVAAVTPVGVVLAKREYEAWFLAAAKSIAGKHRLPEDFAAPMDPEQIPAAKGVLNRAMGPHSKYSETVDQPALTSIFDINEARRAPSFDKCYREIERLIALTASVS